MKRFLPFQKSLTATGVFAILFSLITTGSLAATKTWSGGTGPGKSWTVAGNWTPAGVPAAGDDIVFNTTGTITFSTMPASTAFGSLEISNGAVVTFANGAACTLTIGGGTPDPDLAINSSGSLTLSTNVNLAMAANGNGNISTDLFVNAGSSFTATASGVAVSVFGTINNQGTVSGTAGTLTFGGGGSYVHNQNGGTVPTANWNVASFCILSGITNAHPAGMSQTFGSLTYNSAFSTDITMPVGVVIGQDFFVLNTGGNRLLLTAASLSVGRDMEVGANITIANTVNRTLSVARDVFVSGGGNINFCSGGAGNVGTLDVGGNFTSFGAMISNGVGSKGLINFNGSTVQNFNQSGAFINTIDITINNTAGSTGVTFANSVTLNGALTMTNGILTIPVNQTLTIANGNPIGGTGSSTTFINTDASGANQGFVRIDNMAAGAYSIPTGNGTSYLPITLTPSTTSSFTVAVFTGITENGLPNGTAFTALKKQGVVDAVYTINRNSGTLGVDMTLGWPTALEGSSFTTFTTNQIGISHWDNPTWGNCVGTGDNSANTATRSGVTVFSPFSVGKTPYVLPVKFSYVNAAKANSYNTVSWKASCSSQEVTFSVERSSDGSNFTPINSITATQARCAEPFSYTDQAALSGNVFYRIKSVEVTGVVTYSNIVKLTSDVADMKLKSITPNPVVNQAQLSIVTPKKDVVTIAVVSMEGKILQRISIQLQSGTTIVNLDMSNLQPGVYMIRGNFQSNGNANTLRFVKQ